MWENYLGQPKESKECTIDIEGIQYKMIEKHDKLILQWCR